MHTSLLKFNRILLSLYKESVMKKLIKWFKDKWEERKRKKRFKKKQLQFDSLPIEECYEDFLNILRKNARSRSTSMEIAYNIDSNWPPHRENC
jgi:hypothetical protein